MTNKEAFEMIGARAEAIANNEAVKEKMAKCYEAGMSMEEIKGIIYNMAIATLYGAKA
jgi:hypothetical protein